MKYLIDTNTVSAHMMGSHIVRIKMKDAEVQGHSIAISAITYYEIMRGLKRKNAVKQIKAFERFWKNFGIILPDNINIFDKAADIWAELTTRGNIIPDADIIIASTALDKDFTVVTNDSHYARINDLNVEDWLDV